MSSLVGEVVAGAEVDGAEVVGDMVVGGVVVSAVQSAEGTWDVSPVGLVPRSAEARTVHPLVSKFAS